MKQNKKVKICQLAMCFYCKSNKFNKRIGKGDDAFQGKILTCQNMTDNKKGSIDKI